MPLRRSFRTNKKELAQVRDEKYGYNIDTIKKIIKFFMLMLISFVLNTCQTTNTGYGPGNSKNSILIIVNEGNIKLTIESRIVEDNNNKHETSDFRTEWGAAIFIFFGLLDGLANHALMDREIVDLSAGSDYSYTLIPNETVVMGIKPMDIKNHEDLEVIIRYRGREKIYKNKAGFSKTFSYTEW
jgi:hypothetical protein